MSRIVAIPALCRRAFAVCPFVLLIAVIDATAQSYPQRPIRFVIPYAPGGNTDMIGRVLGAKLTESMGQTIVVENRGGAATLIGAENVAKSPPDGYSMLLATSTTLAINPHLYKTLPYDPLTDFTPVILVARIPMVLVVHPALPVKTVKEFIALAKARPGEINYATSGPGGSGHMAGELFRMVAGVNLVHIPYKGAPPALNELIAGQVQVMFGTILATAPHVRAGRVRAIAITGPQRSNALPEVATFAEAGFAHYDASSWNGILVPAGTPRAIVERLNAELVRILASPLVLERLAPDGAIPVPTTPEEFSAFIRSEIVKWAKVVKAANIRID